jgi:hypothetical protein
MADVFCACTTPETLLCKDDFLKHSQSHSPGEHTARNLSLLSYYKIPGYFERLKCRRDSFSQVRETALRSVAEVEKAIRKFSQEAEYIYGNLFSTLPTS